MKRENLCLLFLLLFVFLLCWNPIAHSDENEHAMIQQKIQKIMNELPALEEQASQQKAIELAKTVHDLEIQISRSSGDQKKQLEEQLRTKTTEYEQAKAKAIDAIRAVSEDEAKIQAYKIWLEELKSHSNEPPKGLSNSKTTIMEIRVLGTACQSYFIDGHDAFPELKTIDDVVQTLQPKYLHSYSSKDSWGHNYAFLTDKSHGKYWIISYGADGKPDAGIYDSQGIPKDNAAAKTSNPNDDIIYFTEGFIRSPEDPDQSALRESKKVMTFDPSNLCSIANDAQVTRALGNAGWKKSAPPRSNFCQYELPNDNTRIQINVMEPEGASELYDSAVHDFLDGSRMHETLSNVGDKAMLIETAPNKGTVQIVKGNHYVTVYYDEIDTARVRAFIEQIASRL